MTAQPNGATAMIVSPKSHGQMKDEYAALCCRLAADAHRAYCRCLTTPLYLIGRTATALDTMSPRLEVWAELAVGPDAPEGWAIVHAAPLSRAKTTEQNADAIRAMLNREPLYIFAD